MRSNQPISSTRKTALRAATAVPILAVFASMALFGCAKKERQQLLRPSKEANKEFLLTQQDYTASRWRDDRGADLRSNRDAVVRRLLGVTHHAPTCPLFLSKLGDVQVELGAEAYDLAYQNYATALKHCPDWIPAYLGLARIELLRSKNYAKAEDRLLDAEDALKALRKFVSTAGAPKTGLAALTEASNAQNAADDPGLTETEEANLLLSWLEWNELWWPENAAMAIGTPPAAAASPGALPSAAVARNALGSIERRIRARIEYQRAEIMIVAGRPAADVLVQLDRALEWDSDFVTATIEKAAQHRRLGELDKAESLLEPFVRPDSSGVRQVVGGFTFENNGRLLYELATLYAERYFATGGPEWYNAAADYFTRLLGDRELKSVQHAEALYCFATVLHRAGGGARLRSALAYIDQARALNPQLPGLQSERAAIAAALGAMAGGAR